MQKGIDKILNWLADSEVRLRVTGVAKFGCDAVTVVGPVALGVLAMPWFTGAAWVAWAVGGCFSLFLLAFLAGRGLQVLDARGMKQLSTQHSDDLSASLRALHGVLAAGEDAAMMRHHVLARMADAVGRVVPKPGAEIFVGLLLREGDRLKLVDYSRFRGPRVPSADFPIDGPDGAARACREKRLVHVEDTQAPMHGDVFTGKTYRCILAFPLMSGAECVGVVAVDSTRARHFVGRVDDLDAHVRPFVEVIRLNLAANAGTSSRRSRGVRA